VSRDPDAANGVVCTCSATMRDGEPMVLDSSRCPIHATPDLGLGVPLVKGPTTYTTACTCDSRLPGYHRMDCGVYV
jgi:hypothetical protein